MTDQLRGRLLLRTLPSESAREQCLEYLLRLYKQAPRERVLSLLRKIPAVLSTNVQLSTAQRVIADLEKLAAAAAQIRDSEVGDGLRKQLLATMAEVFHLLQSYRDQSLTGAYPLEHARTNVRLGEYLVEKLPAQDDPRGRLEGSAGAVERAQRLYARLAARLAHAAEAVEQALGLPSLPEPPA